MMASIYLSWRFQHGRKFGPYGMSQGTYLGPVRVEDDLVYSKADGSCLGMLVRRAEIPKEPKPRNTNAEAAIRSKFYLPMLTHQNINDLKFELPQFSDEAIDAAVADLVKKGVLERVAKGNYRMVA